MNWIIRRAARKCPSTTTESIRDNINENCIVYSPNKYRETEGTKVDGDIVLSTNNPYFIKGSHKDQNIITYEKGKVPSKTFTIKNFVKKDMMGLGTKVGQFSNYATIMYAMLGNFQGENQKEQRDELSLRIKLLREIVGQEIDKIKGVEPPKVPAEWKKSPKIEEGDSEEVKKEKWKKYSMVISKKPYFFRYLYPELNQRFKRYESNYNDICLKMFGIKLKKLLKRKKEERSDEENGLIRKYQQYNPLIVSPCNMNILCKELESADFDIKFDKGSNVCKLPTFEDKFVFDQNIFDSIKKMYSAYNSRKQIDFYKRYIENYVDITPLGYSSGRDFNVENIIRYYQYYILEKKSDDIRLALESNGISSEEFIYYCHKLASPSNGGYKKFNWTFAWDVLGDSILKVIPQGKTFAPVRVNVNDDNGEENASPALEIKEYLGEYFYLKDVSKEIEEYEKDDNNNNNNNNNLIEDKNMNENFELGLDEEEEFFAMEYLDDLFGDGDGTEF